MSTWAATLPSFAIRRLPTAVPASTLREAKPDTWVQVRRVCGSDEAVEQLLEYGLTAGTPVRVVRRAGGHVQVYVRGSLLSLGAELANGVEVAPLR